MKQFRQKYFLIVAAVCDRRAGGATSTPTAVKDRRYRGWHFSMNPIRHLLPLLLLGATGCFIDRTPIVFHDEAGAGRQEQNSVTVVPPVKKLAKADQRLVEAAVFRYLLGRHFWDNGDYTAVFLQTDNAQTELLAGEFPKHMPPIKPSYRAYLPENRTPVDRDTGKPAMVLSVEVGEPNADDSVDAIGRWYAGGAVAGFYTFVLRLAGGEWQIDSVK